MSQAQLGSCLICQAPAVDERETTVSMDPAVVTLRLRHCKDHVEQVAKIDNEFQAELHEMLGDLALRGEIVEQKELKKVGTV